MTKRTLARTVVGPVRIAVYLRVSTAQQLEGYGLKVQEDQCRAWVAYAMRGVKHVVVDVYVDGGVSGKLANRDDLDRMTADAMAGRLDMIVFGKLDRIGRTMKNIHRWVYDVTDKGVRVATADGRIDSEDDMFGIQLSLLAYMAEVEHALILERTMGGRMQKAAIGGWPLGEPPFGIMIDVDGTPALNPDEIKQIEAFADFMIEALAPVTREDAARHLNALGYRTRSGKEWTGANLVRRVLNGLKGHVDFVFAGENEDGEEITTSYRIEIPQTLPDDKAEALKEILTRSSRTKSKHNKYLLSNRLFSVCGGHRTGAALSEESRSAHTAGRYYRCMAGRADETPESHADCWELPCDEVDEAVWAEVEKLMSDKDKLHKLVAESLGTVPDRAESYRARLAELDEQIEKKRSSRKRKIALLLASVDDDDDDDAQLVEEMKAELKQQEADLVAERERVAEWLHDVESQEARAQSMLTKIDKVDGRLEDFTLEQKIDLLDLLDVRVQITGKGVPRHKGLADPITEWHRETGTLIPVEVTDSMWEKVRDIVSGNRQWKNPRDGFEAMLDKLRTGRAWNSYSGTEAIGGRSYGALYRRVTHWFGSGEYERALEVLEPYTGVPVPPAYVLPSMHVTGDADPEYTAERVTREACDRGKCVSGVSCNHTDTRELASPR
ncbi:recombinase family protein [Streptomyces sp. NPDC050095]|uniref:recombinase family protein n=1 Tax=unclassified Streptomyces TaxID=2593676 RepID=UPI003429EE21